MVNVDFRGKGLILKMNFPLFFVIRSSEKSFIAIVYCFNLYNVIIFSFM